MSKLLMFMVDPYFLEASSCLPPSTHRDGALNATVGLLLKPEAISSSGLAYLSQVLQAEGFSVVGWHRFEFTRGRCLEFWRYQTNAATAERQFLMTFYLQGSLAHYVILRQDDGLRHGRNACDRFQALKGKSQLSRRGARDLRRYLGGASAVLNGLHATDHPFDLIRDLGILGGEALSQTSRALLEGTEPRPASDLLGLLERKDRSNGDIPATYDEAFAMLDAHYNGAAGQQVARLYGTRRRIKVDRLRRLAEETPSALVAAFAVFMGNHIDYILRGSKNFL